MPIPVSYPGGAESARTLSGRVHDPNKALLNPRPRDDWQPGDVAWAYVQKDRALVGGPVTYVDEPSIPRRVAQILDVNPDGRTPRELVCPVEELFDSETELLNALFASDDAK